MALPRSILGDDLVKELNYIKDDLLGTGKSTLDRQAILRILWSLRIDQTSFMDDGSLSIMNLKALHKEQKIKLNTEQIKLLNEISFSVPSESQYRALKEMRNRLIEQYSPRPVYRISKPREDILLLVDKLIERIKEQMSRGDATQN